MPHRGTPGNHLIHSRAKKNLKRLLPRLLQCSDKAQTSTTVSGRPSPAKAIINSVLAKSARTKRYDRKQTKISKFHKYT